MKLSDIFFKEMDMRVAGSHHYVVKHPLDKSTLTLKDKRNKLVPTVNAKKLSDLLSKAERIKSKQKSQRKQLQR